MLLSIKNMLSGDKSYKEEVKNYIETDGLIAIVYYIFLIFFYYLIGRINYEKKLYLGVPCNIILAIASILIIKSRNQTLSSIGITLKNAKKSIILGAVTGVTAVTICYVLPGIIGGRPLNNILSIIKDLFLFFIIISFVEEIMFRGFIQTRMYGLIKNDALAVLISAVMFSLMHIPFRMASAGMTLHEFISINGVQLVCLCFMHCIFNFLYRKYNNILAGTIFHGFVDWGESLFL